MRELLSFIARHACRLRLITDRIDKTSPYLSRLYLLGGAGTPWFLALHCIHKSDSDMHFHSHPFHWFAVMLTGHYHEVQPSGTYKRRPGFFRVRSRNSLHRLVLPAGRDVWTLFFGFGRKGSWGFKVGDRLVDHKEYLKA